MLEDLRVDSAALRLFAAIAAAYERVRRAALADRPELALLPPRAAVAEARSGSVSAPVGSWLRRRWMSTCSTLVAVARSAGRSVAMVESSAEAGIWG